MTTDKDNKSRKDGVINKVGRCVYGLGLIIVGVLAIALWLVIVYDFLSPSGFNLTLPFRLSFTDKYLACVILISIPLWAHCYLCYFYSHQKAQIESRYKKQNAYLLTKILFKVFKFLFYVTGGFCAGIFYGLIIIFLLIKYLPDSMQVKIYNSTAQDVYIDRFWIDDHVRMKNITLRSGDASKLIDFLNYDTSTMHLDYRYSRDGDPVTVTCTMTKGWGECTVYVRANDHVCSCGS